MCDEKITPQIKRVSKDHNLILILSLPQRSPLICWVNFLRLWPFFYSILLSFFRVGFHTYLSNHYPFLRKHIFAGFNEFPSLVCCSFSRVLVHCHPSSPTTGAYSFSMKETGFYVCAVWCVHIHGTSCFKSHPRRLDNVYIQGDYSRIIAGSGNQTSATVQAPDHKSNSLTLG